MLTISQQNGICTLSLNRPEVHHAFHPELIAQLHSAITQATLDAETKIIVLTSTGSPSFCAGGDLGWMQSMVHYTYAQNVTDAMALAAMMDAFAQCPKPIVGRIPGNAYGGGVGLVALCDMAVALDSAQFCLSEVKLGLVPAVIMPFLQKKLIMPALHRYALTAERFSAAEAMAAGLLCAVVADTAALDVTVNQWCEALLANGAQAMAATKGLLKDLHDMPWEAQLTHCAETIATARTSPEAQTRLKAFLNR